MNARNRLDRYLDQVRDRLRKVIIARAAAVAAAAALVVTCIAVWAMEKQGFPAVTIYSARAALILALLVTGALLLWRPLHKLRQYDGARELEKHLPAQKGRVETYLELVRRSREGQEAPLLDLLAEDAATVADQLPAREAVPPKRAWIPTAAAASAIAALAVLMGLGGSYWGYGTRHLWFGASLPAESVMARRIVVSPGNATVRKNQDLPIRAATEGFQPEQVSVHVRYGNAQQWESAPMRPGQDGKFEFTLFALREPLSYYVSSGSTRSAEHRIEVADLPRIERLRLTYVYPEWTGLPSNSDEASRDIQAVAGTKVQLEVQTSAPLDSPALVVNGSSVPLDSQGQRSTGSLVVENPGSYRISARVGGELVALTEEHGITVIPDEKPTIEVTRPARDWRANPIEEVPVHVRAADDFRVQGLELRYSVNGGQWQSAPLNGRAKTVDAEALLRLEELGAAQAGSSKNAGPHLTPGDLVSYYAVARDRRQSVQTDLFLVQVQPFDRRFTQGQAGAGQNGAGQGEQENAISERQREILLATWNLQRAREDAGARGAQRVEDNARMLAELQSTLADQARTLGERARARMLTGADEQIRKFVENLDQAVQAMQPAARSLSEIKLQQAIPSEQQALQHLMRAEALFSEIQVAFQQGGAGGGSHAGRDLAEMFELEMDLDKNQYETESPVSADASPQQLEETLRKLRELAKRQERLAREANDLNRTPEQQRWRQEQLRREAEELRRKLAEMAQRSGGKGEAQQGQGSQSNGNSSAAQALNQVEQAIENMKNAAGGSQSSQNGGKSGQPSQQQDIRSAQEASRSLKRALEQIEQGRREGLAGTFEDFSQRARRLLDQQRRGEQELQESLQRARQPGSKGERYGGIDPERVQALADEKRSMQGELQALERDMRSAVQRHNKDAPNSTSQLGEAADELSESNAGARLGRSAMDLERGRTLEAATREGLITEALEALERQVGQAARVAGTESRGRGGDEEAATPDELLAELGELRRAWQQAQAQAQGQGQRGEGQGENRDVGRSRGDGTSREGNGNTYGANGFIGEPGAYQYGNPSHYIEGERGRLSAWNPQLARNPYLAPNAGEFRDQAALIGQRLRELQKRLPRGTLPQTDIAALKALADRLRGSADPMVSEYAKMMNMLDQVELAVLKASERGGNRPPTRATVPVPDSPRYRENVAEYYRRLGEN